MSKNSKYDKCLKDVRHKIKKGKISKTYKCGKEICKTSEFAICSRLKKKYSREKHNPFSKFIE